MKPKMIQLLSEELGSQLKQTFKCTLPDQAADELQAAMKLVEMFEARGFCFKLKDLCPQSRYQTLWRAVFTKQGEQFFADDPQPPLAICKAALGVLTPPSVEN